jgi:hypothetical protein
MDIPPKDDLPNAGYVPGYRTYQGVSLSPYTPRVGALPGGLTPGFAAPMPPGQWTLRWSGYLSATLHSSVGRRAVLAPDQDRTVFHVPPVVVDEYGSFLGTNTLQGQWVAMNFSYGNGLVSANLSFNTWNPSEAITFYQIGSQYFINHAYLQFDVPAIGDLRLKTMAGYFYNYYGNLSQYGLGMYTNSLIGSNRGVGETTVAEYGLSPTLTLVIEHGIMGGRNGKVPDNVIPNGANASANPIFPASFIHHLHAGIARRGELNLRSNIHWMTNWAQDDRTQRMADNPITREIDESYVRDGRLDVIGLDTTVQSQTWGYLGAAASYVKGDNAFPLRGLHTFGGEGQMLTDRWWGDRTGGSGDLYAAGLNYSASLGRILTAPAPFTADGPDLLLNAGFIIAYTETSARTVSGTTQPGPLPEDADVFNGRLRYKFGIDGLYTPLSWFSAGLRVDRVAPSSKDSGETFHVVAARLLFKTSRNSRETISLLYARWLYGPRTHPDASSLLPSDVGLDDELISLNVNMWW